MQDLRLLRVARGSWVGEARRSAVLCRRKIVCLPGLARGSRSRDAEGMLTNLIPKVFYSDVTVGLDLFVDGIGMQILYRDEDLVVAGRDQIKVYLVEDAESAAKDRPELAIETDDIEAVFAEVS